MMACIDTQHTGYLNNVLTSMKSNFINNYTLLQYVREGCFILNSYS